MKIIEYVHEIVLLKKNSDPFRISKYSLFGVYENIWHTAFIFRSNKGVFSFLRIQHEYEDVVDELIKILERYCKWYADINAFGIRIHLFRRKERFMKYIIFDSESLGKVPILFPSHIDHDEVANNMKNLVGSPRNAGQIILKSDGDLVHITCFGNSLTLGLESNPAVDEKVIGAAVLRR